MSDAPSGWKPVDVVTGSKPDTQYTLRLSPDGGAMHCECKSFEFSKAAPASCKHIDGFLAKQGKA